MKKVMLVYIIIIIGLICSFYYHVFVGFGNAALKTAKTISEIERSLKRDNEKILDSVKIKTKKVIDTTNQSNYPSILQTTE